VDDVAVSMAQVRNITGLEGDSLATLTEQALILRDTFGYEVTESVRAADTAMQNFDVSSEHMMDLITTAAQQTGDSTQDLLDTVNEYSADFAAAGYDADMMFQTLIQGSEAGIFNLDKVADGVREFSTRVQEGGDETRAAFDALFANTEADWMFVDYENGVQQSIGSTQALYDAIQSGSVPISLVGDRLADSLSQIEDPLLRNQIGVALLGSIYEDVGDAAIEALNIQDEGLNEAAGATERAGNALQQGLQPAWDRFQRTVRTGLVNAISPYATAFLQRLIPALERAGAWLTATGIPAFVRFLGWLRVTGETVLEVVAAFLGFDSVGDMFSALVNSIGQLVTFLGHLSPESLVVIGTVLAAMAAPAVIGALVAGVTALGGGLVAVTAAAWPLAAALALVVAYETNFGGLRDRVNEFKQAISSGDILGAVQALGGALLAIPRGIADWVAAQLGIDPSGIDAWKNNAQMLGTILQALPGYLVAVIEQATGFNIPEAWENFRQTTNSIKNHIGSSVNRIIEFVAAAATIVLPAGLIAVRETWDRIKNAASAVGGYVTTFISLMAGIVLPTGLAAVQTTWTRVSESASSAVGYVQRFIDALGRIQVPEALREAASLLDSAGGAISGAAGWVGDQLRDSGGPGAAGETYLIGRGAQPELFVPRSAGTFYPAGSYALAGAGGGGGGEGVTITGPVHIYGVQDVESLYEQLQKVGQRRAPGGGRK
jgi:hypothetical protein